MPEPVALETGPLRVSVSLDPFAVEIRRGRRLIRGLRLWAARGEIRDQFVQLTEGVIAAEELEQPPHFAARRSAGSRFWGEAGEVEIELRRERVTLEFRPAPGPLRVGAEWEARAGERFTGLGARHGEQFEQTGRRVRLGADRRYTGPDCPPDMLDVGASPRATMPPCPG